MDPISHIVSENLKKFRQERNLSLQDLSELSGVSKSMLGEIERGSSNPTINVIWKIAVGLKVPFTALTTARRPQVRLVRASEHEGFLSGDGYVCSTVFKYDPDTQTEIYLECFESGGRLDSEGHPGVYETMLVISGTLTLTTSGNTYTLYTGDSILFEASGEHSYVNNHPDPCQVYMILNYRTD